MRLKEFLRMSMNYVAVIFAIGAVNLALIERDIGNIHVYATLLIVQILTFMSYVHKTYRVSTK